MRELALADRIEEEDKYRNLLIDEKEKREKEQKCYGDYLKVDNKKSI
jgi:putative ubiquitin-RnfH superfamily antitoxin RatB of RatAB toxin-antitoxin module